MLASLLNFSRVKFLLKTDSGYGAVRVEFLLKTESFFMSFPSSLINTGMAIFVLFKVVPVPVPVPGGSFVY